MNRSRTLFALLAIVAVALPAHGQALPGQTSLATNAPAGVARSTRVVAYEIKAKVDVDHKSVDATETLTYRNLTGQPLDSFPFHLYLNAFQPDSTFTSETHFQGGIRDSEAADEYPAKKLGSITISHLEADGYGDLTGQLRFVAPDDGNPHDRTVALLQLQKPVAPGDLITFHLTFHDQFPESVARNGYKRDFLMGGQWFPKVGVFWHGAWNCHQYHATTEFFADFGTFNVSLTLPKRYVVGASGVPTGTFDNADGTRTQTFYGEDIHDFAWAASPHFQVTTDTFLSSMGPVQVRVLALAAHPGAGKRYMDVTMGSLKQFDDRYGPYPYKILTVIDPEPGSQIGGMEYPTLFTGDLSRLDPTLLTEITTEHEFGHQYWYGMVATNEFEEAWLDEGINSYTEGIVTSALYGRWTSALGLRWANLSDISLHYLEYIASPDYDPVTRPAWQFRDSNSYGGVTYGKSGMLLRTLGGIVGQDTMAQAMRVYFMRYRFTHPTTEDFLRTIEEVAIQRGRATGEILSQRPLDACYDKKNGRGVDTLLCKMNLPWVQSSSLQPFFDQAVYGTRVLDYAIDSIRSGPVEWWKPDPDQKHLVDTVTIHRIGDFLLPVTLEVVFIDGSRVREHWDPSAATNDRWKTFTYARGVAIASAEIDPDHVVSLDTNHFNDSKTVKANPVPARKITALWTTFTQLASQMAGWLV